MIEVSHLTKTFGSTLAVHNMTFSITEGEVVGLLGPNGAGKTTTMRLLAGYLAPDQGTITINGIDREKDPQSVQQIIGYMPENNPLYKDMLVSDMIALTAQLKNISQKHYKQECDFVVSSTGIEQVYYRPIRELSKGFKQRVGIALALLGRPKIIIMDEPTEGLDPNQRTDVRTLITTLSKNHTILISTHVMQEAQAICHRLIIIQKGQIVADGSKDDLSRQAQQKRMITVDIEGKNVEEELKTIEGVKALEIIREKNHRFVGKLIVGKTASIQPSLSALIHKHKWIVWKVVEEEKNLEDIFHQLTQSYEDNEYSHPHA
jgi:ABC-2 type transport system ATP-binding protein